MTTICHSNLILHRLLTDEGAFIHEHEPETYEDVGDAESGPQLSGGPAFDRYHGESHEIIVDPTGLIVACIPIDWDHFRWCEEMAEQHGSDQEWGMLWPEYKRRRRAGEDWLVIFHDEDGPWFACHGYGWTDDPKSAGCFPITQANQIAYAFNNTPHDRMTGPARVSFIMAEKVQS